MRRMDKQKGQSLFLVTIFLGALSLTALTVFNAGVLSREKSRLQNASDAAAYSAATFVTRDLNFKSYTNRAMVANQVAIGQYVGLSSWMEMMYNSTDNLATVTSWIPYVGAITNAIRQVMNAVNSVAQPALEMITTFTNYAITGLRWGQQAFHYGMNVASVQTANNVIDANDDDISFGAISNGFLIADTSKVWFSFSDNIDTDSNNQKDKTRKNEFREVVNDSRDPFSSRRTYTWLKTPKIPFIPAFRIEKAGGSDLVTSSQNDETWTAMDTVAIWQGNYKCKLFSGCRWKWKEWLPSGWASAKSGENYNMYQGRGQSGLWGDSWSKNPTTSGFAAYNQNDVGSYDGLQNFYDLDKDGLIEKTPSMRVIISKGSSDMRTSANTESKGLNNKLAHWGGGDLNLEEGSQFARDKMNSMSKAESYFKRPNNLSGMRRLDNRIEFANTYSPYWQTRLVDTTNGDRRLANIIINQVFL